MKSMIPLIINREYMTRIRKKSFIVMSILGPFIFAAYVLIPMYFATMEDKDEKKVVVLDGEKSELVDHRAKYVRETGNVVEKFGAPAPPARLPPRKGPVSESACCVVRPFLSLGRQR